MAELADGRYTLLNVAISSQDNDVLPFWLSENPQWNSFNHAAATRRQDCDPDRRANAHDRQHLS